MGDFVKQNFSSPYSISMLLFFHFREYEEEMEHWEYEASGYPHYLIYILPFF
jgi:hypothetical protein